MATNKELEAEIADLKAQLAASQSTGSGNVGFKVTRPRKPDVAKKEIEAARSDKPKTYRALQAGTDYKQGFIAKGQIFTTDQPQGEWMEEVDAKKAKKSEDGDED